MTRETVIGETPARTATSEMVGAPLLRPEVLRGLRVARLMPRFLAGDCNIISM
ncbi:hypothetical protein [Sphingomonas sp. Leaf230]|uniref:hypothetical protein n=1 Tax=Sphingomonas sp. Leaf230 TaxID=1735694 RepID=UPI001F3F4120|nr:hypothetical protein [Sphingomonas sp. Leaf230]